MAEPKKEGKPTPNELLQVCASHADLQEEQNYLLFLWAYVKRAPLVRTYLRYAARVKPWMLLWRVLRRLFLVFAWVQASALLLLSFAFLVTVLPFAVILVTCFVTLVRMDLFRVLPSLCQRLQTQAIFFLCDVPPSGFCLRNGASLASYQVFFILSPTAYRPRSHGIFLNGKHQPDGTCLLHAHAFYALRRRGKLPPNTVLIF